MYIYIYIIYINIYCICMKRERETYIYIYIYIYIHTARVLKNALYKNLKGSDPMRATYFQPYQAHSTLRI